MFIMGLSSPGSTTAGPNHSPPFEMILEHDLPLPLDLVYQRELAIRALQVNFLVSWANPTHK